MAFPWRIAPLKTCSKTDSPLSDANTKSACNTTTANAAYMCHDNIPFNVTSTLSYGFAASPAAEGNTCGLCYRLTFNGTGKDDEGNPPKAGTASLKGKEMIVQATNIGHDVAKQQYDISIPGGGVGTFDACTAQWGVASAAELGAQYGGFLTTCQKTLGHDAHDALKTCVSDKCTAIFGAKFPALYQGTLTATCG